MFARKFEKIVVQVAKRSMTMSRATQPLTKASVSVASIMRIPTLSSTHRMMSSDSSGDNLNLSEVLANELQEEVANDEINQEFLDIKAQISKSFKIKETEGSGVVTLTNTTSGKESIEIVFDCQDEVEDMEDMGDFDQEHEDHNHGEGEEEEMGSGVGIKFHVTITKKGTEDKIVFYCVAGQQISIENVQHLPAGKKVEDTTIYHGPIFDKLSDDVRESMLSYLADRNIDDDMAFFIMAYSENKEQREYMNWLKKVMTFVDK